MQIILDCLRLELNIVVAIKHNNYNENTIRFHCCSETIYNSIIMARATLLQSTKIVYKYTDMWRK